MEDSHEINIYLEIPAHQVQATHEALQDTGCSGKHLVLGMDERFGAMEVAVIGTMFIS